MRGLFYQWVDEVDEVVIVDGRFDNTMSFCHVYKRLAFILINSYFRCIQ